MGLEPLLVDHDGGVGHIIGSILDVECEHELDLVLVDHDGGVGHVLLLGDLLLDDDLVLRPPGGGVPVDDSLPPPSEAAAMLHFPWGLSSCLDILLLLVQGFLNCHAMRITPPPQSSTSTGCVWMRGHCDSRPDNPHIRS